MTIRLEPTRFHRALVETLRELEPGLWQWFASDRFGKGYADGVRVELLRSTYRVPSEDQSALYAIANEVRVAFDLDAPLTIYQSQEDGSLNAGLLFVPGEIHLVLRGPLTKTLDERELRALFGHELAHYELWTREGGIHRIAGALIEHVAASPRAAPSHIQTALRHRKWTEIYADRGAFAASDDVVASVALLVKVTTGLSEVNAEAYLAQAEEVLGEVPKDSRRSRSDTHPESVVRAWALARWANGERDDAHFRPLVEGPRTVEALDLLEQRELTSLTREVIRAIVAPEVMRTECVMTHARRFFPDETFAAGSPPVALQLEPSIAEYFAYVLLDFAVIDPDLEDEGLAWMTRAARELGLRDAFQKVARKELRLSAATFGAIEHRGVELARTLEPAAP